MAQRHTLCPSKASQVNTTQMIKSWGHSSAGLGPQCRRYCSTHIATKDKNQTKTNTLLRPFFFPGQAPARSSTPLLRLRPRGHLGARLGAREFCRSGSQRARRAHLPSLCSGSELQYLLSEYESHYILVSAFYGLPKSCQLSPGSPWEGEDGEREEIRAVVATGVRVL